MVHPWLLLKNQNQYSSKTIEVKEIRFLQGNKNPKSVVIKRTYHRCHACGFTMTCPCTHVGKSTTWTFIPPINHKTHLEQETRCDIYFYAANESATACQGIPMRPTLRLNSHIPLPLHHHSRSIAMMDDPS